MYNKKKNRNTGAILMSAVLMLGTVGCAESQIPPMTDSQARMIEEYVAMTMMKYEANHKSRLVELPQTEILDSLEPTPTISPQMPDNPEGQEPSDNTTPDVPEATEKPYTMEEVMGLPEGVTIVFSGHKFVDSYPEGGEEAAFVLPASSGKKLLVLEFMVVNTSEQEQMIDILSLNAIYGVTINGDYVHRALRTMLVEDMSTFEGSITGGGSEEKVLVIEVDETLDENIMSLDLNVKSDSKAFTVKLL